jgi:hypothetical protein
MDYGTTNLLQVHTFFKAKLFALKQMTCEAQGAIERDIE